MQAAGGDDPELEALRQQRMGEMQRQNESKVQEQEEQKRLMLSQILAPDARERCNCLLLFFLTLDH
jgi:DNA-binding TFAR19-related protein (PDSD5 family)